MLWQDVVVSADYQALDMDSADVDGDGDPDLVTVSGTLDEVVWWDNAAGDGSAWSMRVVDSAVNSAGGLGVGDIDGDGDVDIVARDGLLSGDLFWWSNLNGVGSSWSKNSIATTGGATYVELRDLDIDGDLDVFGVGFGSVRWWENRREGGWTEHALSGGYDSPMSLWVDDVDRDGLQDLLVVGGTQSWWENETIHRSTEFGAEIVVADDVSEAHEARAADLDGDGDLDLVVASEADATLYWYEATETSPPSYVERVVSGGQAGITGVWVVDLDGDGDNDVLGASADDNAVRWFENVGGEALTFVARDLTTSALGAVTVTAADLDADGDVDVVAGSRADDTVRWFESDGGSPPEFVEHVVSSAVDSVRGVAIGDIDGDGVLDLVAASRNDSSVRWFRGGGFGERLISSSVDGARAIAVADLDRDDDLDIVVAADLGGRVVWFENDGDREPSFVERIASDAIPGAISVFASDDDLDGDLDLLIAARDEGSIYRLENDGSLPPSFTAAAVAVDAPLAQSAALADLDRDGDSDLFATTLADYRLAIYPSCGGQASFSATSVAPPTLLQGTGDAVLAIEVAHRGRAGDPSLSVQSLGFLLEEEPGDPLTGDEANALIDRLELYRDTGDGVFSPDEDLLVAQVFVLELIEGIWVLETGGGSNFEVAAGADAIFFVVPNLTLDAGSQAVRQLRWTHLIQSDGPLPNAFVTGTTVPLTVGCGSDVATPIVVAAAYELAVAGSCPGPVRLSLSGAAPNATLGVLSSGTVGGFDKPQPPCLGLRLGLDAPQFVQTLAADASGEAEVTPTLSDEQCGLFIQMADLATCRVSEVGALP